jgi:hypothetical protein
MSVCIKLKVPALFAKPFGLVDERRNVVRVGIQGDPRLHGQRFIRPAFRLQGDALRNHLAKSQVVAVIAYLQKLGAYREVKKDRPAEPSTLDPDSHRKAATVK